MGNEVKIDAEGVSIGRSKIRNLQYYDGRGWVQLVQSEHDNQWTSPIWQPTRSYASTLDDILESRRDRGVTMARQAARLDALEAIRAAAQNLADYYERSLNVGPGNHPQKEALLWAGLRAALKGETP